MSSKSDEASRYLLEYYLHAGVTTINIAFPLKLALLKGSLSDSVQPAATEVSTTVDDTAYAQQVIEFSDIAEDNTMTNTNTITFPACSYGSGAAPYTVTHVAIVDSNNVWLYRDSVVPVDTVDLIVSAGDTVTFQPGDLIVDGRDRTAIMQESMFKLILKGDASGPITAPAKTYLGLLNGSTEIDTINYSSSYVRQEITWASLGTGPSTYNTNNISYIPANLVGDSASNGSFPVTHVGIYDAETGGNLMFETKLIGGPIIVYAGTVVKFDGNNNIIWIQES